MQKKIYYYGSSGISKTSWKTSRNWLNQTSNLLDADLLEFLLNLVLIAKTLLVEL